MDGKALLLSKTFWANVLGLIGMVLTATGVVGEPEWVQYELAALALANVVIRLITKQPIESVLPKS